MTKYEDKMRNLDAPPVTPAKAMAMVAHHLQLAAMYFEAVPDDEVMVKSSIINDMDEKVEGYVSPAQVAARAWIDASNTYYRSIDAETLK
jgi:hypothetical protein